MSQATTCFTLVDLFSGAGGMSFGFHRHPVFQVIAAADAEVGKPSSGGGALQCNATYARNIGVTPVAIDLSSVTADELPERLGLNASTRVNVLSACPPCTGFSRANPSNHLSDDLRNSLVRRCAQFAAVLDVDILVMENARELIRGNFSHHYQGLCRDLTELGYAVSGATHLLSRFGLPQIRERAIVIAVKRPLAMRTLDDLWEGWRVRADALTVRRAFAAIDPRSSGVETYPGFASPEVIRRLRATPRDGGSWMDLLSRPDREQLLTPAMQRIARERRFGSYPDVYGRMAWGKPAQTIKRECAHVGNGRYAHPEADRLCSVREMAMLQGFPNDFVFADAALSNLYRHIGDAVPPLISHQIAHLCEWILTGRRPTLVETLLPGAHLTREDVTREGPSIQVDPTYGIASASGF
ncbi:DNA cytosine methyltransferase [Thiocapsa bogorovii]|uniref:DNA cytosine methyltransferase n=1 Tax=Thiocapsa bogorovii TaxID=521689 RepID=UPI001E46D839|nr:DNA cytosine methyltransferase [Thiocapsa bogorovii]UHD17663.1 DNA cytosine methyltransferase [Thiocapsa bogorovii]